MVSGCQLQVAKLAQMSPAAPSGTKQRTMVPSGGQRWPAVTRVKTRVEQNPGQNPGGAPWSTKSPLKKKAEMSRIPDSVFRPESRGPQGALGGLIFH